MDMLDAIKILDEKVPDPSAGLPDDIFFYISRTTPLVNVDLLINDDQGRTLLSWRNDPYAGKGWHLPGGIVRFKERLETRVEKVAESEVGAQIDFDPSPIAINQIILKEYRNRAHFISILYQCFLPASFIPDNKEINETDPGYLKWHNHCPKNLLKFHEIYRKFFKT